MTAFGLADDLLIEAAEITREGNTGVTQTRVTAVSDEQQGVRSDDFWKGLA